ncbi:hypothetical protein OH77DRAFT_1426050 [Trametes cingulata]|nr:hypothetical protein OH77DRAFT_1426050 [Trametes cingulata]
MSIRSLIRVTPSFCQHQPAVVDNAANPVKYHDVRVERRHILRRGGIEPVGGGGRARRRDFRAHLWSVWTRPSL